MSICRKWMVGYVLVKWFPTVRSTGWTGSSSWVCIGSQCSSRQRSSTQPRPRTDGDLPQPVAPAAVVVLGAVRERDRPQDAHPEPRVGQQPLPVDRHHDDAVSPRRGGVSDPPQPSFHDVAQPLQCRREQDGVLEAVPAPSATDELLLDRVQAHAGVLVEQHVDVVEREGPDVGLVQRVQCSPRRRRGLPPDPAQVAAQVELLGQPRTRVGHLAIQHEGRSMRVRRRSALGAALRRDLTAALGGQQQRVAAAGA